jgi:hypothetical protein
MWYVPSSEKPLGAARWPKPLQRNGSQHQQSWAEVSAAQRLPSVSFGARRAPARCHDRAQVDIRLCENIFHSAGLSLADGDGQTADDASLLAAAVSSSTVGLIWQGGAARPAIATGPAADQ